MTLLTHLGIHDLQRMELESAKRDRRALMDSLAALKGDQGKAGSELQEADISRLRRELEIKQEKLNDLRQARPPYCFLELNGHWLARFSRFPPCCNHRFTKCPCNCGHTHRIALGTRMIYDVMELSIGRRKRLKQKGSWCALH